MFIDFDQGSISVKYRTIVCSVRSPCSWWYVKISWWSCPRCSAAFIVADMQNLKHIVFWLTTKFLSYVRVDFLKMANIVPGYRHVVVGQSCTHGILCRHCRSLPCTGVRMCIKLHHLRTRCSVYYWDPNLNFWLWVSPGCKMHSYPALLEADWQSSTLNSSMTLISQPHVPLLLVLLPASASTTWLEGCHLDWKMAAREHRKAHDVEHVSELVFGVHIFDVDVLIHIDSVKASIKRNPAGSGHVSHRRTSAFLQIILISASLSSKMWSKAPKWESFAFVITWSTLNNSISSRLGCFFVLVLVCFLQASSPKGFSVPERYEKKIKCGNSVHAKTSIQRDNFRFSGNVRVSWSLFLTTSQHMGTNVGLPKIQFSPRSISNLQVSPAKSESWNNPNRQSCALFPHGNVVCNHLRDCECKYIQQSKRLAQALIRIVTVRDSLFTYHRKSGLPMRSKYTSHFRTSLRAYIWQFSHHLKWWSSRHLVETLYSCSTFFVANSKHLSTQFLRMTFHVIRPSLRFRLRFFQPRNFSSAPAEIRDSNIFFFPQ